MYLDVYVGCFDDSFDWDGYSDVGNAPKRRSPFFPSGHESFWELKKRINEGVYEGRQVDWGAWVAKVKRQQIIDFMRDMSAKGAGTSYELVSFLHALDPETDFALVASEL